MITGAERSRPCDRKLASVGHHFFIGLRPTPTLHEKDRLLLRDLSPAGVVLFKSNFHHDRPYGEWLSTHRDLIAAICEATRDYS
jgi:beta-N-acetylhexosaminidase